MAGDWIKMRCNLDSDPAVIGIAERTGLDEDAVVGKLHRLWSWADLQTTNGNAPFVTESWVDRFLRTTGFAKAMIEVGWLTIRNNGLTFPRFEVHNSKTAKKRAETAKRVAAHRSKSSPGANKSNADSVTPALPREEKRREENKDPPNPPEGGNRGRAIDSLDPLFDRFWRAYPVHKAAMDARRVWDELNVDEALLEEMLRSIEAHKKADDCWLRGKIPHPDNWLRGERWKDAVHDASTVDTDTAGQRAERQRKQKEALKFDGPAVPLSEVARLAQEKQKAKERTNDDPSCHTP